MEIMLAEDHPDMRRIVEAAHHDVTPKSKKNKNNSLANAPTTALGNTPGTSDDFDNIEFLIHVLSINRASGAIDDESFEQLLLHIKTRDGRANLADRFAQELETEHGHEDKT